jgi:ribosomal protein S18 acetylase RimI-like enzyme
VPTEIVLKSFYLSLHLSELEVEMTKIGFQNGTKQSRETCAGILARAFANDPVARWIYADEIEYWLDFPAFVQASAGKAFAYDTVYQAPGATGCALWLPPHVRADENSINMIINASLLGTKAEETLAFVDALSRHRPHTPHWYLAMIGVEPSRQAQSIGSELMRQVVDACDADRAFAYLEATTEENSRFYERFGFRTVTSIQLGSSPTLYAMVREPECLDHW